MIRKQFELTYKRQPSFSVSTFNAIESDSYFRFEFQKVKKEKKTAANIS